MNSIMLCFLLLITGICCTQGATESSWQSRWYTTQEADTSIAHYFDHRARLKVAELRKRYTPRQFEEHAEEVRSQLRTTYLMPKVAWNGEAQLVREVTIDGLSVEIRYLKILPGLYSVLRIFRPAANNDKRHPALLYLPGHGDPAWDPILQRRLLAFAKQGYVVMMADPFGQGELTDTPLWSEYHGCQAMAYLLTTGQSLLGLIMASHTVELSYLCSRGDVNPDQVVVMGGSMGGTHTLWLTAIDQRIKAAVPISAAPTLDPDWNLRMHCLCDSQTGVYNVADGEIVRSLIAPRPLLVIYPDLEAPISDEGWMLMHEDKLDFMDKPAKSKYFLTDQQMAQIYPFARKVYALGKAPDRFKEVVVEGPHGDAKQYRELANGWFSHVLMGKETADPIPEPRLSPLQNLSAAKAALWAWPEGQRPKDFLGPNEYTKKAIFDLLAKLPPPPSSPETAKQISKRLREHLPKLLGVSFSNINAKITQPSDFEVEGVIASRYEIEPEPGVILHTLMFKPSSASKNNGYLYVLLHPEGVKATAASEERKRLTDKGAWVVCPDLRGTGSTFGTQAAYVGVRDQPLCVGALKLGETVAGWWTQDVLAVVDAARKIVGVKVKVIVNGKRETGLVAILAAGQSQSIDAVEVEELLASYGSADGYGFPYVYGDKGKHNSNMHVYGSMVPCIPKILNFADVPQLAAMVCPRPLTITNPLWATGERVPQNDLTRAFAWTRIFYGISGCDSKLVLQ